MPMFGGGSFIRRARRAPEWLRQHPDRFAIGCLILLATTLFAVPALNGSLVLPGDDLFQNEPLRVLTGSILRSGRLPAWDPLIWSGTPLLAGWNAGSMFPGTWLFAVLPEGLAWTVNLALAYAACSTGAHLLLRRIGVGPIPALFGALIFTYTGFMNGQVVHIGLIQGTAFTPWILIALEMLANSKERRPVAGAIALLGAASSLTVLAGDPRAATSAAIIAGIWFLGRIVRGVTNFARYAASVAAGVILGAALSSIQWIPGIGFLHSSQRANAAYSFFSGGSFDLKTLGLNLLAPYLIGGNGNFGLPVYTGGYNLPEVTIGAGLLSLVAAGAYLPAALGTFVRWMRRRERVAEVRPLGTAYALVGIGVLLALGGTTPLGHLLVHLPLYGGERLQNRNAVIFDLGLSLLVAFLIEDILGRRGARTEVGTRRATSRVLSSWPSVILGAVAPLAAAGLIGGAYFWPVTIGSRLDVNGVSPRLFRELGPYLIPSLVAAVALLGFVLIARRLPRPARVVGVIGFVLVDLLTFLTGMGLLTVPTSAVSSSSTTSTTLLRLQGPNGRSAIYNAASLSFGLDPFAEEQVGVPDLNLLRDIPSVQGYGSIVNSSYENETDTHLFEDIGVSALDGPTFDTLDLTTLLTLPAYLDIRIPSRSGVPIALGHHLFTSGPNVANHPPLASGPYPVSEDQSATFLVSGPTRLSHLSIILDEASGGPSRLEVTAVGPEGGSVTRFGAVRKGQATVEFPSTTVAERFVVRSTAGLPGEIGAVVAVTTAPVNRLLLDGALQNSLDAPHWTYSGNLGPLTVFTNHQSRGEAWVEPPPGAASGTRTRSVHIVSNTATAPLVMDVDAPAGGTLVRSEEYAHGWTARLQPEGGGPTTVIDVQQDGLIQKVPIPPGKYIVTWKYAPAGVLVGLVLSALGTVIFIALLMVSSRRFWGRSGASA